MRYPATYPVQPRKTPLSSLVTVPGSKSITNRALILAAFSASPQPIELSGALRSEDTEVMIAALETLGYNIEKLWDQVPPTLKITRSLRDISPVEPLNLYVANSGTSMRFLTAFVATRKGEYFLDGIPRMRERPIQDLLEALNQLNGIEAHSLSGNGCPPVSVHSNLNHTTKTISIRGKLSSQFLSAILMASPRFVAANELFTIELQGELVSEPYIEMTTKMMAQWGYQVERPAPDRFTVRGYHPQNFSIQRYEIEPDASAASYFWAMAAICGGRVTVSGLSRASLQGDVLFVEALEKMGCRIEECSSGLTVHGRPLQGIDIDMNAISDTVMTLAAVACFAEGTTTIRNVGHIRHKETDRLSALTTELRRVGVSVEEFSEGLKITPAPMHGARLQTYNDHRMAMSLALIGLRIPDIVIEDPGCVAKTYPGFWHAFERV